MPISYNSVSNLQSVARQEALQEELDAEAIGTGSDDEGYAIEVSKKINCPIAMADDDEQIAKNIQGLLKEKAEKAKDSDKKRTCLDKNNKTNKTQGAQKGGANDKVGSKDQTQQVSKKQVAAFDTARFQKTTQDRANLLYPESLPKYQEGAKALANLPLGATEKDALQIASQMFNDVAEQHNLLETTKAVLQDELTLLQGGELKGTNAKGEETRQPVTGKLNQIKQQLSTLVGDEPGTQAKRESLQREQKAIEGQIKELSMKISTLGNASGELMQVHGARIQDSYTLAPEIRETVGASSSSGDIMPAKSFAQIILDQILPLKGDRGAIFNVLTDKLVGSDMMKTGTSIPAA